ncbi:MAG: hypothetical protein AB8F78_16620 [Saprospiraceae bacterium]
MRISFKLLSQLILSLCIISCGVDAASKAEVKVEAEVANPVAMQVQTVLEVTSFAIHAEVDPLAFVKRDAQVEADFTSKQPGFIKRHSGVDESNNYVVVVYWESMEAAAASMAKFMSDASVADYAQMIDGPTMQMARYTLDTSFDAARSSFVEVMSFNLKEGADLAQFEILNLKVETDFTGKQQGFLQRLTGVSQDGRQVVAVYWASKAESDAVLQAFMEAPIANQFLGEMDQASMRMGRYELLNEVP